MLLGIWIAVSIPLLVFAISKTEGAFAVLLGLLVLFGTMMLNLRCPRCRKRVMFKWRRYLGWLPSHCPWCGLSTQATQGR